MGHPDGAPRASEHTESEASWRDSNGAHDYVLDIHRQHNKDVQTASDGHTVLIPQPSTEERDPLNWGPRKKASILFLITVIGFLPDFASGVGTVTLLPQAVEWHRSQNTVQHNLLGNIFALGAGGLISVTLSDYFGRLPVLFWCQLLSLGTGVWCALARSYESYLAARIVNGLFACAAQAGGLMWIKDIFFVHEHQRKINIWTGGIIISPYLGPFCAAFIISATTWRWSFYLMTMLNGIALALIVLLGEETYYRRAIPLDLQPQWRSRLRRMIGIERHSRRTFMETLRRPAVAISKGVVFAMTVYYFLIFAWVIGVNATTSVWLAEFYHFGPVSMGLFYFAPMAGTILGELIGHWAHDTVGALYAKRHEGRIRAEARLILCYPATVIMVIGMVILGLALQNRWHYMVVAVFIAMQIGGIMITTTAVNAYLLHCYPEGAGEVGAWVSIARALGGFMAIYIEIPWVTGSGPATALGIQAAITGGAVLIPLSLQLFGERIRRLQGPMLFPD